MNAPPAEGCAITGHRTSEAMERLEASLKRLQAVAEVRGRVDDDAGAVDDLVARLERDRAELAAELDACHARAETLRRANEEVAARLVRVMERMRRNEPADGPAPEPGQTPRPPR